MSESRMNEHSDEYAKHLKELKRKVQLGIQQIANGEYVEYRRETLHELFDEIEEEGLKRLEERRTHRNVPNL